jgi:hypothetical protein
MATISKAAANTLTDVMFAALRRVRLRGRNTRAVLAGILRAGSEERGCRERQGKHLGLGGLVAAAGHPGDATATRPANACAHGARAQLPPTLLRKFPTAATGRGPVRVNPSRARDPYPARSSGVAPTAATIRRSITTSPRPNSPFMSAEHSTRDGPPMRGVCWALIHARASTPQVCVLSNRRRMPTAAMLPAYPRTT